MQTSSILFLTFLISTLTLALELLQTRILSIPYWYHLVYFVITMSLLGIAAAGTFLSLYPRVKSLPPATFFSLCLIGFSISAFAGTLIAANLPNNDFFSFWKTSFNLLNLLLAYFLVMLPYFSFGLFIAGAFLQNPGHSGPIYFSNLLGSAFGCLLYLGLIRSLGAENLLLLISVVGMLAGVVFLREVRWPLKGLALLSLTAVASWVATTVEISPEINKLYWKGFRDRQVEFSQWNAISRIDVVSEKGEEDVKRILIDGDAQTPLYRQVLSRRKSEGTRLESPLRDVAYALSQGKRLNNALVIGPGGGLDVAVGRSYGVDSIEAVEINPTIAEITSGMYSSYLGDLFKADNVRLEVEDGRSFVRRSKRQYDVITLFAVDSRTALSTGAYVLAENYLYTLEAFSDYWEHLSEQGMLMMCRWYYPKGPRETLRAFITAYEALLLHGVRDPSAHLLVVAHDVGPGPSADLIVSRQPFQKEQLLQARQWCEQYGLELVYSPARPKGGRNIAPNPFERFVAMGKVGKKERKEFLRRYPYDVSPVSDDNPFFFQYGKWSHVGEIAQGAPSYFTAIQGAWPFFVILSLIIQSTGIVALLVLFPLWRLKKDMGEISHHLPIVLYFGLLGLAFMFIEIPLIQKFVLLLGHPIYSIVVTVPSLLIAAGIGSLCSGFLSKKMGLYRCLGVCIFTLAVLVVMLVMLSPAISRGVLQYTLAVRIATSVALVFPVGFLMGVPFPVGMRALSDFPQLIPIAWAVNGGTSVIGSVTAIAVAMTWCFSTVMDVAVGLYLLAFYCFLSWRRQVTPDGSLSNNL